MKFFLDTANVQDVEELLPTGFIDGITTNPSLIAASGQNIAEVIKTLSGLVGGPVSAEVTARDAEAMIAEGQYLAKIAQNIAVKVPLTPAGLIACRRLRAQHIMVNVTLCFSPAQALLAAKAGATFISPFIGRLDDIGHDGMQLIQEIRQIYDNYEGITTEILAASLRGPQHVVEAAQLGADVATLPPKVLHQLYQHPLTDSGLEKFLDDWKKTGQKIGA